MFDDELELERRGKAVTPLERLGRWLDRALWVVAPLATFFLLWDWRVHGEAASLVLVTVDLLVAGVFIAHVVVHAVLSGTPSTYLLRNPLELLVLLPVGLSVYEPAAASAGVMLRQVAFGIKVLSRGRRFRGLIERAHLQPKQVLATSFLLTIVVGALLLSLPVASSDPDHPVAWEDALFTSTSAVCVTGLIVKDTPRDFSPFGHVVILALIQVGGLGIMTLSASVLVLMGRKVGLRQRVEMQDLVDEDSAERVFGLFGAIVEYTVLFEVLGALVLAAWWYPLMRDVPTAIWYGAFHAVSAFCNAGFALFSDSLMGFRGDPVVNIVICSLILVGGLGFVAILNLADWWRTRRHPWRIPLTLSTRLAVVVSLGLILVGTAFVFFVEYDGAFSGMSLGTRVQAAVFTAVTPRTAGFNTVDFALLSPATILLVMALMFIGASPGGTGGGVKTTTFGVLLLTTRSVILGSRDVTVGTRKVGVTMVARACSIIAIAGALVFLCALVLLMTERGSFTEIVFEVVSAFGTVGLSLGLTPRLSLVGKLLIVGLMYVGRIGPMTLALALAEGEGGEPVAFPEERVLLG